MYTHRHAIIARRDAHKVPLRSRGGHGGRRGAAAIRDHSTLNVHDVLPGCGNLGFVGLEAWGGFRSRWA